MTDHLAAAISASPIHLHHGVIAALSWGEVNIASQVQVGETVISCIDECIDWRHEIGDPVALEWGADGTCYVVRSLAYRPRVGTVVTVSTFTNTINGTVRDRAGGQWNVNFVGTTPAVGDQVEIMWGAQGAIAYKGLWFAEGMHPGTMVWDQKAPALQTSGLPDLIPEGPDPLSDITVQAAQSGTVQSGAWRHDKDSSRLIQGSMIATDPASSGCWLYAGGLDFLAGRVITAATIQLTRTTTGTPGVTAPIVLRCHTASTQADTPAWVGDTITGPALLPGETATVTLTPSLLAPLAAGTAHGLGIVGGTWCEVDGVSTSVASGQIHITSRDADTT